VSVQTIRKNDVVIATRGISAGKTGKVLQVLPSKGRAVVEGLNLVKKALRKSQDNPKGGIADKESSIALANLMQYCPQCKKGVRITRVREAESRGRKCRRCGHAFES
jgi:large subunit ribosomal protein L24